MRNLEVLEAEPLQPLVNAQGVQLTCIRKSSLVQMLLISDNTNSKYAFGECHTFMLQTP